MSRPIHAAVIASIVLLAGANVVSAQEKVGNWSGFYLGAHGGHGWSTMPVDGFDDMKLKGALGGLHLGYQWQWGRIVAGLEADASATSIKYKESNFQTYKETHFEIGPRWLATARARLGYDFGPALLYATGGIAWNDWSFRTKEDSYISRDDVTTGASRDFGWVLGGGGEFTITDHLIVRLEGLYYDFKDMKPAMNLNGVPVPDSGPALDQTVTVVRSGLSWRF